MKNRLGAGLLFSVLCLLPAWPQSQEKPPAEPNPPVEAVPNPQEFQTRKPKDYMSSFFARDTKPLGLKEDAALKRLVREPGIKWACRTGTKHILE